MAINNIINDQWQGHSHGEVEDALKALLATMLQDIEAAGIPAGGVTAEMLAQSLQTLINGKYSKPGTGIPANDLEGNIPSSKLASAVQTSLGKADTALQSESDPVFAASAAHGITSTDINNWNNKANSAAIPTKTSDLTNDSGFVTETALAQDLERKQDTLTFDNAPTANSNNPVKSGGVYTALAGKQDTISDLATIRSKAGSAIQGIIVGGTEVTPDANRKVTIPAGADGVTPHIGQNGNWWVGPETNSANDTGIKARGNDGNVTVSDGVATLVVGNVLNGQGDVLGMSGAMQVKSNIDTLAASLNRLYAKLDNLAFWSAQDKTEAAPTALDWGAPKHIVTLSLTLTHAVVKYNGVVKNNGDTIPNVEEGSTIQLTVEAESGYELDSISSQAGTVNGSTVSLVMGTSNATLDITASASAAYTISYDLSNCAAPTGVTNPTTIKSGETKTIYLEAGNNFTMPASLPAGAVTGATAAYTRDSQDDTLASIVLSNASGNVTVDIDGVEIQPELHLVLQALIDASNGRYFIQGGSYNSNAKRRAMVVVKRAETSRPCTWGSTDGVSEDAALEAEYSTIPIPIGATQITMKCNSTYYYTIGLVNSSGVEQNADSAWTVGSTQKSWLLADYPNATHIKLNFKIGSAGTTNFSNETYESMGIDFNIE